MTESIDKPVLEPLSLHIGTSDDDIDGAAEEGIEAPLSANKVTCIFCDTTFYLPCDRDNLLKHLVLAHKLVVADVPLIADLKSYIEYWKVRFAESDPTDFCAVIRTNCKPTDPSPSELYYLLCDSLPEDKDLRVRLQRQQLEEVLARQQLERDDVGFAGDCLFCTKCVEGGRSELFNHMAALHNFNVGHPDNLVYKDDLLQLLREKLRDIRCFYCEKTFKDSLVLKEHMRKKNHKRLHSSNAEYNRFYTINYLEFGKNWMDIQAEEDRDIDDSDVESTKLDSWNDWDEPCRVETKCLFCDHTTAEPSLDSDRLLDHLKTVHGFDLRGVAAQLNLTFYQQVKLINYIRRQLHQNCCPYCGRKSDNCNVLREHLKMTGHASEIPPTSSWDQPQYFFPTYENDDLLWTLDDERDVEHQGTDVVIAEDSLLSDMINSHRQKLSTLVMPIAE